MAYPNIDHSYLKPDHPLLTISEVMATMFQKTELGEVVLEKEKQKQQDLLCEEKEIDMGSQA